MKILTVKFLPLACFEFGTLHIIRYSKILSSNTHSLTIYYFFAGCSQCNLKLWWLFITICRLWRSRRPRSCHLHSKKTAQFHQKSERLSNGQNWGRPGWCLRRIWQNTNWQRNCERTSCDCRKRGWHRWELENDWASNIGYFLQIHYMNRQWCYRERPPSTEGSFQLLWGHISHGKTLQKL